MVTRTNKQKTSLRAHIEIFKDKIICYLEFASNNKGWGGVEGTGVPGADGQERWVSMHGAYDATLPSSVYTSYLSK